MEGWKQWLEQKIRDGHVCTGYTRKISEAMCKADFFNLCLDVNGMNFMGLMSATPGGLPYEDIKREFSRYINGQYEATFKNDTDGLYYTSSMYMGMRGEEMTVCNTCTLLLDCRDCVVKIPEFSICCVYVDSKSKIEVKCPLNSIVYVEVFGSGEAYSMTSKNVEIIRR